MFYLEKILNDILNYRLNAVLDQVLRLSESYKNADDKSNRVLEKTLSLMSTDEQQLAIDDLVSIYNNCAVEYAKIAYQQGFYDGINLVTELLGINMKKQ